VPDLILILSVSYLLGSIPTSILVARLVAGIDIREHGSGNAGATNVLRVLGWKAALPVAIVDVLKGTIAAAWISKLHAFGTPLPVSDPLVVQCLAGVAAVVGHIWPIFAGFRGGKGVATTLGMLLDVYPVAVPLFLAIFLIVLLTTGYVSLSSITAATSLPLLLYLLHRAAWLEVPEPIIRFTVLLAGIIVFAHRSNIHRLLQGRENRMLRKR